MFKVFYQMGIGERAEIRFGGTFSEQRAEFEARHYARMTPGAVVTTARGKVVKVFGWPSLNVGQRIEPVLFKAIG